MALEHANVSIAQETANTILAEEEESKIDSEESVSEKEPFLPSAVEEEGDTSTGCAMLEEVTSNRRRSQSSCGTYGSPEIHRGDNASVEAETVVRSGNPSQHHKTSKRYYHSESRPQTLGRKGSLSLDPKFATKRSVSRKDSLDSFGGESDVGLRSSFSTNSSSIPRSSSTLSRKSSIGNIWSKLSRRQDVWDRESLFDQDGEDEEESNFVATCLENTFQWLRSTLKTACSSPFILIVIALVFTILCTCGILVTDSFDRAETEARIENAKTVAQETDVFFQRVLERAFVPLFTIAQFVKTVDIFHDMPLIVGDRCSSENITDCTDTAVLFPLQI
jgi:hypothetical protein